MFNIAPAAGMVSPGAEALPASVPAPVSTATVKVKGAATL